MDEWVFNPKFPSDATDDRQWLEFVRDVKQYASMIQSAETGILGTGYMESPRWGYWISGDEEVYTFKPISEKLAYYEDLWYAIEEFPPQLREELIAELRKFRGADLWDCMEQIAETLNRYYVKFYSQKRW